MKTKYLVVSWGVPLILVAATLWFVLPFHTLRADHHFTSEPLHSTTEALGAFAGLLMAFFLLNRTAGDRRAYFFWVAIGFLAMGWLDGFHAVAKQGTGFVWLHSVAGFAGSLFFALAWISRSNGVPPFRNVLPWLVSTGAIALGVATLVNNKIFPVMVVNGQFTHAAKTINFASGMLFSVSALHFALRFKQFRDIEDYLFFLVTLFFALAGFTFKYSAVWADEWWFWHFQRLSGFSIVLAFLIRRHLQTQRKLHHTNRALKMLSECNQILVRTDDESALLEKICSTIINLGGYGMAWVGPAVPDEHEDAMARNCPSRIALPLRENGTSLGVLNISSGESNDFDDTEMGLLSELAADLSYGISTLRTRTARAKAESQLMKLNAELEQRVIERTNLLEAANKELQAFSYSVSHDLRAPLRSIDGFSQAILEDYSPQMDGQCKNYFGRIRSASQRMAQLIDDILRLSRITRAEFSKEVVNLSDMVTAIAHELRRQEPERKVEFAIKPGLTVSGDSHLLRIAFENLLGNAWKFTSKRDGARIEFGTATHDGRCAYFVRDNGVGFEMAYAGKLFGAFQRLHSPTEFPGTGIGLATVQRIIHRHGGKVWAEAKLGEGATFYLAF